MRTVALVIEKYKQPFIDRRFHPHKSGKVTGNVKTFVSTHLVSSAQR